ncbi:MAG: hypothetical protein LBD25_07815 [Coriobacteriales bacterium]|jgi:hypothetical protein|nr:hypothetical protein [Coriobacteriales bacterium]
MASASTQSNTALETIDLEAGFVSRFDCNGITLHAYCTNDAMNDVVHVLEKSGRAVVVEQPNFTKNITELEGYLASRGLVVEGVIAPYHMPGCFLPDVPRYTTRSAEYYGRHGKGKRAVDGFMQAFAGAFDGSMLPTTGFIEDDRFTLAGIEFEVVPTADAFDLVVEEAGLIYTHLLGHDTHSIVESVAQAQASIDLLNGYVSRELPMALSSHHGPETLDDVREKAAYLVALVSIASAAPDAESFKSRMRAAFPGLGGEHYLDMTAQSLFAS